MINKYEALRNVAIVLKKREEERVHQLLLKTKKTEEIASNMFDSLIKVRSRGGYSSANAAFQHDISYFDATIKYLRSLGYTVCADGLVISVWW